MLANLWARGAALQCCFNQSSIDCFIVTYFGSVAADAVFDPDLISDFVMQIKLQSVANTGAERKMRRGAIPNDPALPYLAMLMELGTESTHQKTRSKLKSTIPEYDGSQFQQLEEDWASSTSLLATYRKGGNTTKARIKELREEIKTKRLAMDSCNRYSISARGGGPDTYGILNAADIVKEFATLLRITTPPFTDQDRALQHMRPCERLGHNSSHTTWMAEYVVTKSEGVEE